MANENFFFIVNDIIILYKYKCTMNYDDNKRLV